MTRSSGFITAAILLVLPRIGWAQDMVSLEHAIQQALQHNASLRAARAAAAEEAAALQEARAAWYPRIDVSESWQRGDQPVFVFSSLLAARQFEASNFAIDSLNHPDPTGFFRTSVGLEQTVIDVGRSAAVRTARLRHRIAQLSADEAASTLVVMTTQTFGRIVVADAGRRAAETALEAAREDMARATRRRDEGMATDADVLALAAHVADVEQRVIQSHGEAGVARAELNRLMGADVGRRFGVTEPTGEESAGAEQPEDALIAEAERARAELRRAEAAEQVAEAARTRARAALVPQVVAQGAFEVSGVRAAERTSAWVIGGQLRWSFSLGGSELARLAAATQAGRRARADVEDTRAAVRVEVISALRRLEAARARRVLSRAAVDQARESQRIIRNRFDVGAASVTDVLRASSATLAAEAQRVAAVVDTMVGQAMLRRALGR